jgi:large-conductance mechanosensitive channel
MVITALITFVSTAAAIFFFVAKPANAMLARLTKPGEDVVDDEEPEQFA